MKVLHHRNPFKMSGNRNEYFPYDDDSDGNSDIEINDDDDRNDPAENIDEKSIIANETGEGAIEDEIIEISDESSTGYVQREPEVESNPRISPIGLKRYSKEVLEEEEVAEDGKRKTSKPSPSPIQKNYESREVTGAFAMKYSLYCLMKMLIVTGKMELPVRVTEVDYNEADETMLLRYRTLECVPEEELQLKVYDIFENWETRALKLESVKMEFLKSKKNGQGYLDSYLKEGLLLHNGDKQGHGIVCLKNEKLLGAATFTGGVGIVEKQLEEKIESESYALKEEETGLLGSKEWEEFKDKEVPEDLMLIERGNCC